MDAFQVALWALTFILGITVGSFLNVIIFRFHSGLGMSGRSKCLSCGKTLRPMMLIPLFSYLLQKGRCAYCGAKLSMQYPLVEGALGTLFVLVLLVHSIDPYTVTLNHAIFAICDATIWTLLLAITVYDVRHKIIPDIFSLLLAVFSGLYLLLRWSWGGMPINEITILVAIPEWIDWIAAPAIAVPFALLWFFSRGRAMGLGDAKLAWGLGWFLGFSGAISAAILAFWVAFIPSMFLLLLPGKRFTMKSEIPFGPFLVIGALLVYGFGIDILAWTL